MHTHKPTTQEEQLLLDEHRCSIAYAVTAGILLIFALAIIFGIAVLTKNL